jgi:hypothetical protein
MASGTLVHQIVLHTEEDRLSKEGMACMVETGRFELLMLGIASGWMRRGRRG